MMTTSEYEKRINEIIQYDVNMIIYRIDLITFHDLICIISFEYFNINKN